jgi:enoyl-CoA hydratase
MQCSAMENIIVTAHPGFVQITLNREAHRNALNTATLSALAQTLAGVATNPALRCVLIHGVGGNFAAGADIAEIETKTSQEAALDPRKAYWATIAGFAKPLIAAVDGFALGGGLELALMADLLVVAPNARLGLPETNLGLIPGAGGTQRLLARVGRARASRMVFLGEIIDGTAAHDWGIASHLAEGDPLPEALALAQRIALRAPLALMTAKRALVAGDEAARAFATERAGFEALMDSADKAEGILAFREKRKPEYRGE